MSEDAMPLETPRPANQEPDPRPDPLRASEVDAEPSHTIQPVTPLLSGTSPPPGPGFLGAIGSILLVLVGLLVVFVPPHLISRQSPGPTMLLAAQSLGFLLFGLVRVRQTSGGQATRPLALRRINPDHVLLILLLSPPLFIVNLGVASRIVELLYPREHSEIDDRSVEIDAPAPRTGTHEPSTGGAKDRWSPPGFTERLDRRVNRMLGEMIDLPWYVFFFAGCVLPAVSEELFFRGYVGRGLLARLGLLPGTFLTSLLFALMHIEPSRVCTTLVMGIVLHMTLLLTRSLFAPMLLHFLNNTLALATSKLLRQGEWEPLASLEADRSSPLVFVAAIACVGVLLWVLYETRVVWRTADGQLWSPGYVTAEMPPVGVPAAPQSAPGRRATRWVASLAFVGFWLTTMSNGWQGPDAPMLVDRGNVAFDDGNYSQAIVQYSEAIRSDPSFANAYFNRALAHSNLGDYDAAIADYSKALEIDPKDDVSYDSRAWILATCANEDYRDGKMALADATRACELANWNDARYLHTLAAAYAECGQFTEAVHWQQQALDLASQEDREDYQFRLEGYRAGQPYHAQRP